MPGDQGSPRAPFFMDEPPRWVLHVDAGASPNPGRMAVGAHLQSPDGRSWALSQRLTGVGCNNEAEIRAVTEAVRWALMQGAHALQIHTDSRVVVDHHTGQVLTTSQRLSVIFDELAHVLSGAPGHTLTWVPRHRNDKADALAREALGLPPKTCAAPRNARRQRR